MYHDGIMGAFGSVALFPRVTSDLVSVLCSLSRMASCFIRPWNETATRDNKTRRARFFTRRGTARRTPTSRIVSDCHILHLAIFYIWPYFTFDRAAGFSQTAHMFRTIKKFIAVLLAVWFPLFSGNALAVSVAMQTMSGDCCAAVAQQDEHHARHATTTHQHTQPVQIAVLQDQSAQCHEPQNDHQDQQNSPCENCGVCHLACSGYLATVAIKVAESQPLAQLFTDFSAQFQSIASTPLDPPPLARA